MSPAKSNRERQERIARIGLHPSRGNQFDEEGVSHFHLSHERSQQIVEGPGIGRGFQHHCIREQEVGLCPGVKLLHADLPRGKGHVLGSINGCHHDILLVNIQGHKALRRLHR